MSEHVDVAIVGSGPAGLAVADTLGAANCRVALLDEQQGPGGQVYRGIATANEMRNQILGSDYAAGSALLSAFKHSSVNHFAGATVWEVTPERRISWSAGGNADTLSADHIVIATGATERPMPFAGWTLPGVMTAGAGQILLKSSGLLPSSPCILAGSGPLVFLLARQYLTAGLKVDAIVETTPSVNLSKALPHLPGALLSNKYLRKGLSMLAALRKAAIPHYRRATGLVAEGTERVNSLSFKAGGKRHRLTCSTLMVHTGVVPNVQISRCLNLDHDWHGIQQCWQPRTDAFGATSAKGIRIAGDGAGIAGVEAAVHGGRLAALAILVDSGKLTASERDAQAAVHLAAQRWHARARPFLDALYAPSPEFVNPPDRVIICRCEEVTAGHIREYVDLGCEGPNQAKSFGRSGMGPCQGRYCGLTVSGIIAAKRDVPMDEVGYFRIRPPLKPITLGELATIDIEGHA